jgi:hypothetical protein
MQRVALPRSMFNGPECDGSTLKRRVRPLSSQDAVQEFAYFPHKEEDRVRIPAAQPFTSRGSHWGVCCAKSELVPTGRRQSALAQGISTPYCMRE